MVEIVVPEINSSQDLDLDLVETKLTLDSVKPVCYKLELSFSYPVVEAKAVAKFDKVNHVLTVTVPVKESQEVKRLMSTDSGIDIQTDYPLDQVFPDVSNEEFGPKSDPDVLMFPSYSCNIYEDLMIFTLDVKNVDESSLVKKPMDSEKYGFGLEFTSVGSGFVNYKFGFHVALVVSTDQGSDDNNLPCKPFTFDPLSSCETEVWENNVIVKVTLPKDGMECIQYKVGSDPNDLTIHQLPQLKALRKKKEKMSEDSAFLEKERHSSGESQDSLLSESVNDLAIEDEDSGVVILADGTKLRSILKRNKRCFSESHADFLSWKSLDSSSGDSAEKKSVRFNEIMKKHVFRADSTILGMTKKNAKKREQKRRRAERRASEGESESEMSTPKLNTEIPKAETGSPDKANKEKSDTETNSELEHEDSGLSSCVENETGDSGNKGNGKKNRRKKGKKNSNTKKANLALNNDLIFDLDF